MLTPRGWGCAALAALLLGAGRTVGVVELSGLGGAVFAVILACLVVVWLRPLPPIWLGRATRTPLVAVGETARIQLRVMNRGWRPCPMLLLRDHVDGGARRVGVWIAPLEATERRVGAFRLPTRHRGRLRLGPVEIIRVDPLGLVERVISRGPNGEVVAHPAIVEIDDTFLPWRSAAAQARRHIDGSEFHGLRAYNPGDDLRRVHWPSMARTGDLLVRTDAPADVARLVLIRVDTSLLAYSDNLSFELALGAAASFVRAAATPSLHGRQVVRLQLGDQSIVVGETPALLALTDAKTTGGGASAAAASEGTVAVLGPNATPPWARSADLVVRIVSTTSTEPQLDREARIGHLGQLSHRCVIGRARP